MKEYISHYSAALYWDIPYIDAVFSEDIINIRREGKLTDITVTDSKYRRKKKCYNAHSCYLPLPRSALVKHGDVYISSPELIFVELAKKIDIQKLILFGIQLCAHSSGKPSEAVTTKRRISNFMDKVPGYHGLAKAKRALKFIENGSASIMESLLFMILTLPYKLGGYGLSGACFNHEILLDSKAQKQLMQKRCFADIFFTGVNLDVEYDSYELHNNQESYGKDMLRSDTLNALGIEVMHISAIQLYKKNACEQFARNLGNRLGKRMKYNKQINFIPAHNNLRKLLPSES